MKMKKLFLIVIAKMTGCALYKCIYSDGWLNEGEYYWFISKGEIGILWKGKNVYPVENFKGFDPKRMKKIA